MQIAPSPQPNQSENIVPPSDEEDETEFSYLTKDVSGSATSASQNLRDHCKAHEQQLAAEALKYISKFMAHTYRLNRDVTSPTYFPKPTFQHFISYTKVCALAAEENVGEITSVAFSPVLQRYDSNGNYCPSPTLAKSTPTYHSSDTVRFEEIKQEPRRSAVPAQQTLYDSESVVALECSPNKVICISDEDDTQELIRQMLTPGISKQGTDTQHLKPMSIQTKQPSSRKLFADLRGNSARSNRNFSDDSPISKRKNANKLAIVDSADDQVNPKAAAPSIVAQVPKVVSAAPILVHTIPCSPSMSSVHQRLHRHQLFFLKLASIAEASFSISRTDRRLQLSVRFANRSHFEQFDEASAQQLLQMHGAKHWAAAQWLMRQQHSSYTYCATESEETMRHRSLSERVLHVFLRSRTFVRDAVVVAPDLHDSQRSRVYRYKDAPTDLYSGSLDEAVSAELRYRLRQHRLKFCVPSKV